MRRLAVICTSLLLLTALSAQQNRVRGQIRNGNGGPEPQCQVDFFWNQQQELTYRVYSDKNGFFYLDNPRPGPYHVVVSRGTNAYSLNDVSVSADGAKLVPDVFVVPW